MGDKIGEGLEVRSLMENRTGKGKEGMIGRPAAVVILILASVLFSYSVLLYQYTTRWEGMSLEDLGGIPIPANQTFSYDFVIIYTSSPGWGTDQNASGWYEKVPLAIQTAARWARDHFTFRLESNTSDDLHARIYDSSGEVVRQNFHNTWIPVIPKEEGGRVALSIAANPVQSDQPYVGRLYIKWTRKWYEKPFYNHGIAGLLISTVCPILLLVQHITTLRKGERRNDSS